MDYQPSLFEEENEKYDAAKTRIKGKIFVLERGKDSGKKINIDDLQWDYLEGDGDFRSDEVRELRDEADIIITNPPFSLFREFIAWIFEANKKFAVIGNKNAITYKDVFPLIMENKIWLDNPFVRGAGYFTSPLELNKNLSYFNSHDYREGYIRGPGVRWFTNLEHGKRHKPLENLTTMEGNKKHSRHKEIRGIGYQKYDNYDALEVPFTDAIPTDYIEGAILMTGEGGALQLAESWEFQSASSTNTARNSSRLSESQIMEKTTNTICSPRQSADEKSSSESSSVIRCNGVMGVPISFLDKYCPEQFEILGCSDNGAVSDDFKLPHFKHHNEPYVDGKKLYKRIFIRHRK